jgi:DNA-binding transcriptional LysR family regulator
VLELLVAKGDVPLPVREAIVACELFGISENNVQVTLERLTIEALLEGAGRGSYQLGPQAKDISSQLFEWRSVEQHLRPWARLPKYMVNEDVQAGCLVPLLQAFSSPTHSAIYALRAAGDYVPARTRVFIAFLAERLTTACLNEHRSS